MKPAGTASTNAHLGRTVGYIGALVPFPQRAPQREEGVHVEWKHQRCPRVNRASQNDVYRNDCSVTWIPATTKFQFTLNPRIPCRYCMLRSSRNSDPII